MALLKRNRRSQLGLAGMGLDLAASVAVGALLGWWIDSRYGTSPWWTLILATVGIVGGLLNFVRAGQRAAELSQREAEEEEQSRKKDGGGTA